MVGLRRFSLQAVHMGTEGKIKVDEHYPTDVDDPPLYHIKKIESIRSNVKFEQCYESSQLIGDGKFGRVYAVREKASGNEFAAKVIRIKQQADRQEVEREVSILTQLRHPRIAQIYDAFYTPNNEVVLIMEIVRGGELFDRVADESYVLTEMAVVMIICQLCEAIDYIHEMNILHLDIKPENIMCVSQTGNRIKLIDFGLARYYDGTQELRYMAGTPEFAAPEVIKYEQLDYHTDMWSVGVITYILLSGYSPFLGENLCETYCNVEKGIWDFTEEFDLVSREAKDFISRLIVYKKEKRMLPKECLAHPWIARHRAKASCDAILEKPAEGPVMDNKQMMRYNAQRKLRLFYFYMRMIIYVRFLMEMNRLRSMIKDRLSSNAKKYFEPLLKIADEKEQTVSEAVSGTGTSKLLSAIAQSKIMKAEKVDDRVTSSDGGTSHSNEGTAGTKMKQFLNPPDNNSTASPASSNQKPTVASVAELLKKASEEKASKRPKAERKSIKDEKSQALDKSTPAEAPKKELSTTANSSKESEGASSTMPAEPMSKWSQTAERKSRSAKKTPVSQAIDGVESSVPVIASKEPLSSAETKPSTSIRKASKTPERKLVEGKKANVPEVIVTVPTKTTSTLEKKSFTSSTSKDTVVAGTSLHKKEASKLTEGMMTADDGNGTKKLETASIPESSPAKSVTAEKSASDKEKKERRSLNEKKLTPTDLNASKPPRPTSPVDSTEKTSLRTKKSPSPGVQRTLGSANSFDEALNRLPTKSDDQGSSSTKTRKGSAPEAVITTPPKKTVLGAPQNPPNDADKTTPIRMQRFGSSESGDSTKENRSVEEKKPTRQGALRKKEKPTDNLEVISPPPPPTSPSKLVVQPPISSMSTLLKKRQIANEEKEDPEMENGASTLSADKTTQPKGTTDESKMIPPRPGSVQERLLKLNGRATLPIVNLAVSATSPSSSESKEPPESVEPKKGKLLPITTESKAVTTTLTSTSTKSRKANLEKKVQHVSEGKSVEEVERTCTEQDEVSITKITLRKAETLEKPGSTVSMKKNLLKQDLLRSTAEKERVEEQSKDAAKTTRTARSATSKTTEKVTVVESSKVDGKQSKVSMAGTTDVTRKVVEKSEVKPDSLGKPVKETQLTATEKVKTALDVEKNAKKGTVEKLTTTKVTSKTTDPQADTKDKVKTGSKAEMKSTASKTSESSSETRDKVKSAQPTVAGTKSTTAKASDTPSVVNEKAKAEKKETETKRETEKRSEDAKSDKKTKTAAESEAQKVGNPTLKCKNVASIEKKRNL
ncbi:Protein kinase domain-containing protein [Trichostrongylus colubriformis]|uniref:Protein kinase domain-containing protein n=1 Tax=Trichostrongylus colubriformis TaxID=6319 RepID=A0AAN8FX03_TRICO